MKKTLLSLAAVALLVPGAQASAQSGWWEPVVDRLPAQSGERPDVCRVRPDLPVCGVVRDRDRYPTDRDRYPSDRDDGRWETDRYPRTGSARTSRGRKKGNGPPFCRNGAGHPTKGRAWCREKGWDDGWYDAGWSDVIYGRRYPRRRTMDRGGLIDVLGDVVLGRIERRSGLRSGSPLQGRFLDGGILQIRVGGVPVAELLDANADGRVDRTVLLRRR